MELGAGPSWPNISDYSWYIYSIGCLIVLTWIIGNKNPSLHLHQQSKVFLARILMKNNFSRNYNLSFFLGYSKCHSYFMWMNRVVSLNLNLLLTFFYYFWGFSRDVTASTSTFIIKNKEFDEKKIQQNLELQFMVLFTLSYSWTRTTACIWY